ncbi:unnamed protein product [Acanthosepion pharaonis]|uniref:Uncharacterized protein n=1 Tax=Acanthosepion pharaonis TaxID=158019 RepID=A0A812CET2_ACAPH|nr:unnamed protein product [Sepia pharaonis]
MVGFCLRKKTRYVQGSVLSAVKTATEYLGTYPSWIRWNYSFFFLLSFFSSFSRLLLFLSISSSPFPFSPFPPFLLRLFFCSLISFLSLSSPLYPLFFPLFFSSSLYTLSFPSSPFPLSFPSTPPLFFSSSFSLILFFLYCTFFHLSYSRTLSQPPYSLVFLYPPTDNLNPRSFLFLLYPFFAFTHRHITIHLSLTIFIFPAGGHIIDTVVSCLLSIQNVQFNVILSLRLTNANVRVSPFTWKSRFSILLPTPPYPLPLPLLSHSLSFSPPPLSSFRPWALSFIHFASPTSRIYITKLSLLLILLYLLSHLYYEIVSLTYITKPPLSFILLNLLSHLYY